MLRYGVEISKSYQDDDGNWIVEGIASTEGKDEQEEIVDPKGLETSYFLNKGFIKWEHSKSPNSFIGEPLEAKVLKSGQFWIKGKLYKHAPLAKEAIEAVQTLEKSGSSRKIGFSIEASVVARDRKNPKRVTKAILRNVAMTFNPVNTDTWAELAKSLESLEVDMDNYCNCGYSCGAECCQITGKECLHKTLDTGAGSVLMPESLDDKLKFQDVPPEEEEDKPEKLQRSFFRYIKSLIEKRKRKLTKGLNASTDSFDELGAFVEATEGLDQEEAEFLASYITQKSINITSLVNNPIGGVNGMPDEFTKALDKSLDMLNKSQNLETSAKVGDAQDEEEEEEVQKSFTESLKEEDAVEKAFEVSEFLEIIAEGIGEHIDGFGSRLEKSLSTQNEVIGMIAKTLTATADVIKSLGSELAEQKMLVKSLSEQVEELAQQPVGRKSVVNAREVQTLQKSFGVRDNGGQAPALRLTKPVVVDMLVKSFEKGEISGNVVTVFETSGYLPPEVRQRLGLAQ